MKTTLKYCGILVLALAFSSFSWYNFKEPHGTFGVSSTGQSRIQLIIQPDHSFYFQDYSDAKNKIIVTGRWKINHKKVILIASNSTAKFHNVWTFEANGQIAKSRKGLCFYRLCKLY